MLGSSLDDQDLRLPNLGAAILIDVIEHLPNPMRVLQRLADALVSDGRMVIFTGNTDALAWQVSGRFYWYSALPEHVTFYNVAWFRWAAPRLGCTLGRIQRLAHDPAPLRHRLTETLQNLACLAHRHLGAIPGVGRLLAGMPFARRMGRYDLAWWTSAKDHLLIEIVKHSTGVGRSSAVPNPTD
jgi:hypothetical protein